MGNTNKYIKSLNKSEKSVGGNSKLLHYISTVSSVLTGGHRANIQMTPSSENRNLRVMLPFGFASFPHKGMQAQVMSNESCDTIVGFYDNNRPNTKLGDVILYNRSESYVKIDADGIIYVHNDSCDIKLDSSGASVTGTFRVNGQTIEEIISRYIT